MVNPFTIEKKARAYIEALRKLELDLNFEHVQTDLGTMYEVREFLETLIASKREAHSEAKD